MNQAILKFFAFYVSEASHAGVANTILEMGV